MLAEFATLGLACVSPLAVASCAEVAVDRDPAHSPSFDPVRGSLDSGAAAEMLYWRYRINGGKDQPVSGVSVRYMDEEVTATRGERIETSSDATLGAPSQSLTGSVSSRVSDRLSSASPAAVTERTVETLSSTTTNGRSSTTEQKSKAMFSPARSVLFDRDDLDSLEGDEPRRGFRHAMARQGYRRDPHRSSRHLAAWDGERAVRTRRDQSRPDAIGPSTAAEQSPAMNFFLLGR